MLITVPILSYLGSEGNNIIPFPYDNIIVFISGLLIYGLGFYLSSPIKFGELQIKGEESKKILIDFLNFYLFLNFLILG